MNVVAHKIMYTENGVEIEPITHEDMYMTTEEETLNEILEFVSPTLRKTRSSCWRGR